MDGLLEREGRHEAPLQPIWTVLEEAYGRAYFLATGDWLVMSDTESKYRLIRQLQPPGDVTPRVKLYTFELILEGAAINQFHHQIVFLPVQR